MKQYICKKKSNFGGKMYFPGDVIPLEAVDPDREKKLISYGKIAIVESADAPKETTENVPKSDPQKDKPDEGQPETDKVKSHEKKGEK